jgi:hypothetical protein
MFEPETVRAFAALLAPGMSVMDIGANVGQFTLMAAARVGATGQVHAFEPTHELAAEISERRPEWAGAFALTGELAELAGSTDQAIGFYLRAVALGDVQPSLVRRLVAMLNERNRLPPESSGEEIRVPS